MFRKSHLGKVMVLMMIVIMAISPLSISYGGVTDGAEKIVSGHYHNLVLKSDGTIIAWGDNQYGQSTVPEGLTDVVDVAAGSAHSAALKSDGTIVVWGDSTSGQYNVPAGLTDVKAIAAGDFFTVALKEDGTVVTWGDNGNSRINPPVGLTDVKAISAGEIHCVALKNDGTVVTWGSDIKGQVTIPADVTNAIAISAGKSYTVAVKSDGTVAAWGSNLNFQCDIPEGLTDVVSVEAGFMNVVALKADGTTVLWGSNVYDHLKDVDKIQNVKSASLGQGHIIVIKNDGTIVGIGYNAYTVLDIPQDLIITPAPQNLTVSESNKTAVLNWGAVDGATSYTVKRGTVSGTYTEIGTNVTGTTFTDSTVAEGGTYFYVVTATKDSKESAPSNEVTITISVTAKNVWLHIKLKSGLEKDYIIPSTKVDSFVAWYGDLSVTRAPFYKFERQFGTDMFSSVYDYIIFDQVSYFEARNFK